MEEATACSRGNGLDIRARLTLRYRSSRGPSTVTQYVPRPVAKRGRAHPGGGRAQCGDCVVRRPGARGANWPRCARTISPADARAMSRSSALRLARDDQRRARGQRILFREAVGYVLAMSELDAADTCCSRAREPARQLEIEPTTGEGAECGRKLAARSPPAVRSWLIEPMRRNKATYIRSRWRGDDQRVGLVTRCSR